MMNSKLQKFGDGIWSDASFMVLEIVSLGFDGFLIDVRDPNADGQIGFLLEVKVGEDKPSRTQQYTAFVLADLSRWCYMCNWMPSEKLFAFRFGRGFHYLDFNRLDFYRIKMAVDNFVARI